jgi:hypothetical protein
MHVMCVIQVLQKSTMEVARDACDVHGQRLMEIILQ